MSGIRKHISEDLLMPFADLEKAFEVLRKKGWVYTPAKSAKELEGGSFPVRLPYKAPAQRYNDSKITLGPFPLKIDHYLHIKHEFKDLDVLQGYLMFQKLQYEKLGVTGMEYKLKADDSSLARLYSLMSYYDIENPEVKEHYAWFVPTLKCKSLVEKLVGRKFGDQDFSWWNFVVDLGKDLQPSTMDDYPDKFSLYPVTLFDKWSKYFPAEVGTICFYLYLEYSRGGQLRLFTTISEAIDFISEKLSRSRKADKIEMHCSHADRELLIKELCDYNALPYPVTASEIFDYLQKVHVMVVKRPENQFKYGLARKIRDPEKILRFPLGWQERAEKFLATGSVLFSYLDINEITQND